MTRPSKETGRTDLSSMGSSAAVSAVRQFFEALACLVIAVALFRVFQVEGYMISTGSMAPCLLGYHKRITCPSCGFTFAVGIAFDRVDGEPTGNENSTALHSAPARCPNCGRGSIDVSSAPRNEGDQLLVHKGAYLYRPPHRWEVIVFRNPARPTQAFVKRVVGLPNELIQIVDGDVYANGVIQRKNLASQYSIRIPVYDQDYRPSHDPEWQSQWVAEAQSPAWRSSGNGFTLDAENAANNHGGQTWSWLHYRHWIRSGGTHCTSVPLYYALDPGEFQSTKLTPIRYSAAAEKLSCFGALSEACYARLKSVSTQPAYLNAIDRLYQASHIAPVADVYGYNRPPRSGAPTFLRDLMVSARVAVLAGQGAYQLQMTDGRHEFDCIFDTEAGVVRLNVDHNPHPVRTASLPPAVMERPVLVEMSLMDQQVLVAVDGQSIFVPWTYNLKGDTCCPRDCPVSIGARGLKARVDSLKLYRDVYYTQDQFPEGVATPFQLNDGEVYVLGDNSPVSRDSRSWSDPAVPIRLLIGKPFLVHLPSRRCAVKFRDSVYYIRIPDFSRMRYIH